MFGSRFLISVLTVAVGCIPARASLTYYSNTSAFNAAVVTAGDAVSPIDFSGFVGVTNPTETDPLTGTIFSTTGGNLDGVTPPGGWPGDLLERTTTGSGGSVYMTITPPAGTLAFELYLGNLAPGSSQGITFVTVSATGCNSPGFSYGGGCAIEPTPAIGAPVFTGVVSDTAITSITISADVGSNQYIGISGFELGGTAPTPEGRTSILIGSGLILLPLLQRRLSSRLRKTA